MTRIYRQPFAHNGAKQAIPESSDPQGFVSIEDGFTTDYELPDTDPNYKPIERSEFNGLVNEITEALGEVQQFGYAKWQAGTWPQGSRVLHAGVVYRANTQTSQQPPHANWDVLPEAFGTAAGLNVTTSPTDTTASRILKVGDYGLGDPAPAVFSGDVNSLAVTGFFSIGAGATNLPAGVTIAGSFITHSQINANAAHQLLHANATPPRLYLRIKVSGTWSAWSEVAHTARLLTSTGQNATQAMTQKAVTDAIPPVVQGVGQSTTDVMSQKAVSDALAGGGVVVVQGTGQSTTDVMSQKAVTDALASGGVALLRGIPLPLPVATPPPGMIACNGASLNRSSYLNLWNWANARARVVSDAQWAANTGTFSSGNGSTTFRVPDLRGEFIRGMDVGRGVDPSGSRLPGTVQLDEFKSHTHTYQNHTASGGGGGPTLNQYPTPTQTGATGGAETRPRNVALMWCMYY